MRNPAAAFMMALTVGATATSAEPSIFHEETDIAFRDIFETLETKIEHSSDQDFFESQVLKGQATKSVDTQYGGTVPIYQYTYGAGKRGSYSEAPDGKGISIHFHTSDFSNEYEKICLTFKQAETGLRKHGWSRKKNTEDIYPPAKDIYAVYIRRGVSLKINNFEMLTPWLEPFNSAEGNRQILAEAAIRRQKWSKMKRGTEAYDKLCVTSVDVNFVR